MDDFFLPHCTLPTRLVGFSFSFSQKQQSAGRRVANNAILENPPLCMLLKTFKLLVLGFLISDVNVLNNGYFRNVSCTLN